jgi:GNAT superfamily N-acetyltransferase
VHKLRLAVLNDVDEISQLIQLSARQLGAKYYDKNTIEKALNGAFGVDTQLIKDQTYYVIIKNQTMVACGGWSFRQTLFGSDHNNIRDPKRLDPKIDAAKIRAFFIHPHFVRQGLGNILLEECETQARRKNFSKCQLMSTLSGIDFYKNNGYQGDKYIYHDMDKNNNIKFLPMFKQLENS